MEKFYWLKIKDTSAPVMPIKWKWFGLRVLVDFPLNRKPFWVWRWQLEIK